MARFQLRESKSRELAAERNGQERRGVKASAQRFAIGNRKQLKKQVVARQDWQPDAWAYFDEIGEIKYPTRLAGNVLSKLRFYVAIRPPDEPEGDPIPASDDESPIPIDLAQRAEAELERLKSPFGGKAEIVRMTTMNLDVVAECYLVGIGPRVEFEEQQDGSVVETIIDESWEIKSTDEVEISRDGKTVKIVRFPGDANGFELDPAAGDCIVRIWERHPRYSYLPDNAMRGALGVAEGVSLLENQIKAIAKSHMSAGVLLLPNELEQAFDERQNVGGDGQDEEGAQLTFREALDTTLAEPIQKPDSVASVAPMPLFGPNDVLPNVRHLSFARPSDASLDARLEGQILRLARALDIPVETVLGHQQTTFANAAVIDEDKWRSHYEPKAVLLCDAWTVGFLQPNLVAAGEDPNLVSQLIVWYDPSAVLRGVEPHETADRGWDIGAISDEAWRRVNGWTEEDAPDPVERLLRSIMRLRTLDPGLSTAIMELLGVPLNIPAAVPAGPGPIVDPNVPPYESEGEPGVGGGPSPKGLPAPPPVQQSLVRPLNSLAEALLWLFVADKRGELPAPQVTDKIRATATPAVVRAVRRKINRGQQLMALDRDLRTRLQVAAHVALMAIITRAGNKLKTAANGALSKKIPTDTAREMIRGVHPTFAAMHMGRALVAAVDIPDANLLPPNMWNGFHEQWNTWVAATQARALDIVGTIVPLSSSQRVDLAAKQERNRNDAWDWLLDQLQTLVAERLYQPNPSDPGHGEFDPSISVPVGMIRQAVARAGGASGLQKPPPVIKAADTPGDVFVALNNDEPMGGIGTGELMSDTLDEGGATFGSYVWDYGPAFRKAPFEDHEALDGVEFSNFDDSELDASDSWVDSTNFFPGDHDGCCCDVIPIITGPDDVAFNEATGEAFYLDNPEDVASLGPPSFSSPLPAESAPVEALAPGSVESATTATREYGAVVDPLTRPAEQAARYEEKAGQFKSVLADVKSLHGLPTDNRLAIEKVEKLPGRQSAGFRKLTSSYNRDTKTITVKPLTDATGGVAREKFNFLKEYGQAIDDTNAGSLVSMTRSEILAAGGDERLADAVMEFRNAVHDSDGYRRLTEDLASHAHYLKYATQADEMWGRAYAQWATESSSADLSALRDGLDYVRTKFPELQWSETDFAPIRAAIDKVLDARGLLTEEAKAGKVVETEVKKVEEVKKEVKKVAEVAKPTTQAVTTTRTGNTLEINHVKFHFNDSASVTKLGPTVERMSTRLNLRTINNTKVDLTSSFGKRTTRGQFMVDRVKVKPSLTAGQREATLMHELGHRIDYQLAKDIPITRGTPFAFASEAYYPGGGALADAWREFRTSVIESGVMDYDRLVKLGLGQDYIEYVTSAREVWARAFSQYMTQTFAHAGIGDGASYRAIIADARSGYYQWSEAQFAPIGRAVERVLAAAGFLA